MGYMDYDLTSVLNRKMLGVALDEVYLLCGWFDVMFSITEKVVFFVLFYFLLLNIAFISYLPGSMNHPQPQASKEKWNKISRLRLLA